MERELMPDYAAEAFYQYLIPSSVFQDSGVSKKEVDHCVVFVKKWLRTSLISRRVLR